MTSRSSATHVGSPWITCVTRFRDWRHPLARQRTWTPLFFLDEAVALAAGHRPCATCRRPDYLAYRDAVSRAAGARAPLLARELDERLRAERLRPGRGLRRAADRIVWSAPIADLPDGTVTVGPDGAARLVLGDRLLRFSFEGWLAAGPRPARGVASVLTPPTSVAALADGYPAVLHATAASL